jgi:hypothetical protein
MSSAELRKHRLDCVCRCLNDQHRLNPDNCLQPKDPDSYLNFRILGGLENEVEFVKRAGLLRCYVARVEDGHRVPAVERLERLARALKVQKRSSWSDAWRHDFNRAVKSSVKN